MTQVGGCACGSPRCKWCNHSIWQVGTISFNQSDGAIVAIRQILTVADYNLELPNCDHRKALQLVRSIALLKLRELEA